MPTARPRRTADEWLDFLSGSLCDAVYALQQLQTHAAVIPGMPAVALVDAEAVLRKMAGNDHTALTEQVRRSLRIAAVRAVRDPCDPWRANFEAWDGACCHRRGK